MRTTANPLNWRPTGRGAVIGLWLLLASSPAQAELVADWLGADGFEYPPPTAMRISELYLRDPHVFLQTPFGCVDFTDTPIPLTQVSFNGQIAQALNGDSDPADGLLDASSLLLFHPASQANGSLQRLDQVAGDCTAPVAGTVCSNSAGTTPTIDSYLSSTLGACLEAIAGTTSGYSPGLPSIGSPCWLNRPRAVELNAQGTLVPLADAQQGGEWAAAAINNGLQRGFISENAAAQVLIPNPLSGQPPIVLASLLPGGAGSCASGDDRDLHLGVSGWWFYFEYRATEVPYAFSP